MVSDTERERYNNEVEVILIEQDAIQVVLNTVLQYFSIDIHTYIHTHTILYAIN